MKMSDAGRQRLTERFEGLKLCVYPDPGTGSTPLTAGYGHTGADVTLGMTVTQAQADEWLAQDLGSAESAVNRLVRVALTQDQFDACCDFCFNVGSGNFAGSTLLTMINNSDIDGADAQFGRWVYAHGQVLQGLVARRAQEAAAFSGDAYGI